MNFWRIQELKRDVSGQGLLYLIVIALVVLVFFFRAALWQTLSFDEGEIPATPVPGSSPQTE